MASRALVKGRKYLLGHLNVPVRPCSGFSSLAHGRYAQDSDTNAQGCERESVLVPKEHLYFSSKAYLNSPASVLGSRYGISYGTSEVQLPLGVRWLSQQSIRTVSTATASQPEVGHQDEDKEGQNLKQKKEASPEECDQAVEGLSSAKAKAKAKQLQEAQKPSQSIVQKLWAKLLGIGPALRAVASMSRADWAVKLHHWKNEFVSTLQHYWLGLKLLWADVRISSRLLLKLAGGKSLTRRERQQLTRTTADIFRLVPVAVFIIVPFMEFLLPVFLKMFPNMLPSTFQDKMKEQPRC